MPNSTQSTESLESQLTEFKDVCCRSKYLKDVGCSAFLYNLQGALGYSDVSKVLLTMDIARVQQNPVSEEKRRQNNSNVLAMLQNFLDSPPGSVALLCLLNPYGYKEGYTFEHQMLLVKLASSILRVHTYRSTKGAVYVPPTAEILPGTFFADLVKLISFSPNLWDQSIDDQYGVLFGLQKAGERYRGDLMGKRFTPVLFVGNPEKRSVDQMVQSLKSWNTLRSKCGGCGAQASALCSRCLFAVYCSRECQKDAWNKHKESCKKERNLMKD